MGKFYLKGLINNNIPPTHGIVHAGFSGLRRFVARKKVRCKLIGNRHVIPHDTIPSNVRDKFAQSKAKKLKFKKE